jgi:hypothetical protein
MGMGMGMEVEVEIWRITRMMSCLVTLNPELTSWMPTGKMFKLFKHEPIYSQG